MKLPLSAISLCQLLPCHLGPTRPVFFINCMSLADLTTVGAFHVSIPAEPSLLQDEVQVFNAMCASNLLDLMVTMSCGLTLQICLIIVLSFAADVGGLAPLTHCRKMKFPTINPPIYLPK